MEAFEKINFVFLLAAVVPQRIFDKAFVLINYSSVRISWIMVNIGAIELFFVRENFAIR